MKMYILMLTIGTKPLKPRKNIFWVLLAAVLISPVPIIAPTPFQRGEIATASVISWLYWLAALAVALGWVLHRFDNEGPEITSIFRTQEGNNER